MNNLTFEILFVENDTDFVESCKSHIERALDEKGFKTKLIVEPGATLDKTMSNKSFDLIILDLNLEDKIEGSSLIPQIRKNESVADILFYSDAVEKYNKSLDKISQIDGIYFCRGRKDLIPKIKKLIEKSIKKQQTISNLRGLVISEALDLEYKMGQIIIKFFGLQNNSRKSLFEEKFLDSDVLMLGKKSDFMNSICKHLEREYAEKIDKTMSDETRKEKEKLIKEIYAECASIQDELVKIRNIVAHVKPDPENPNILKSKLKKNGTIIIDDAWCISTRKNLIKHSENLEKLNSHLS